MEARDVHADRVRAARKALEEYIAARQRIEERGPAGEDEWIVELVCDLLHAGDFDEQQATAMLQMVPGMYARERGSG